MRSIWSLGVSVLLATVMARSAEAASIGFLNVPIPAEALADDPNLANRVTTDLKVTVPVGSDWSNAAIEIVLSQGGIYNATNAAGTEGAPNQALWGIPTLRNGQADTFVTTKSFGTATIVGSFHNGADLPPPAEGLTTLDAKSLRVSWGDTSLGEDGTFTIGRFTLSSDAVGTFNGRTFSSESPGSPVNFAGTIVNGVFSVPEPSSAMILALISIFGMRRRTC